MLHELTKGIDYMKILPIEEKPYIKIFSYHAYPASILGSRRFCGEKKAEISISNSDEYMWGNYTNQLDIHKNGNDYVFYGKEYMDAQAQIYRECGILDEITVKVNYMQYTQPYGYISLYISDGITSESKNTYTLGVYNKGDVFYENDLKREICKSLTPANNFYYLRLQRSKELVSSLFSLDGEKWETVSSCHIGFHDSTKKLYLGINLDLGENEYYNWLFTNYVQIYGRNVYSSEYFVDYFVTPEKDGDFKTLHSLLHYSRLDKSVLLESGADLLQFIKSNINRSNYIELWINEYYVEGTRAYRKFEFNHPNMVYGYDEVGVYIMGYANEGFISTRRLEYSDFLKAADNNLSNIDIVSFKPLDSYYKLNIETLKGLLYEYWKGINTNLRIDFILQKDGGEAKSTVKSDNEEAYKDRLPEYSNIYGLKIYDIFLENETMFQYLLRDRRISFIIYEHKKIMKDRVFFLYQKKHIKEEFYDEIMKDTDFILNTANYLKLLLIKYQVNPKEKEPAILKGILMKLKEAEAVYYPKLIESIY